MTPIVIYPEVTSGNPLGAACVVRYVLNFPGLIGGDKYYHPSELVFGFSQELASAAGSPDNILCIPNSDTQLFYPPENGCERKGTCFFAFKHKHVHNEKLIEITKDSIEITSGLPSSQTPEEIAELFRRSEFFYAYENTALALEATLCGCPAIFIPNEHLTEPIGVKEFGYCGISWGLDPNEIARAIETVGGAQERMEELSREFFNKLDQFIQKSQNHTKNKKYHYQAFLNLLPFIAPHGLPDRVIAELRVKETHYAQNFLRLPWRVERALGAFLCTIGLKKDGEFLWNRATKRGKQS